MIFLIVTDVSNGDFKILGNDGGSQITPFVIDMSEGGKLLIGSGQGATYGQLGIESTGDAQIDLFSNVGSGAEGKAEIFFSSDSGSDHVSMASIVMQQDGAGDRKGEILFNVSDNAGPATAVTIQNNKNVILGAGIAIGGTGAVNTLDDYEEGTFTPDTNIGFASVVGEYVKVGSMVHFAIQGTFNAGPGDTSQASAITGLPFSASPGDQLCEVYVVAYDEHVIGQVGGTAIGLKGRGRWSIDNKRSNWK